MRKYIKNIVLMLVLVSIFVAFSDSAWAASQGNIFSQIKSRAMQLLIAIRPIVFILAGFGLIGFAWGAIFNKISWKLFANIAIGLFLVANMGLFIDYFVSNDGSYSQVGLSYGSYMDAGYNPTEGSETSPQSQEVPEGEETGEAGSENPTIVECTPGFPGCDCDPNLGFDCDFVENPPLPEEELENEILPGSEQEKALLEAIGDDGTKMSEAFSGDGAQAKETENTQEKEEEKEDKAKITKEDVAKVAAGIAGIWGIVNTIKSEKKEREEEKAAEEAKQAEEAKKESFEKEQCSMVGGKWDESTKSCNISEVADVDLSGLEAEEEKIQQDKDEKAGKEIENLQKQIEGFQKLYDEANQKYENENKQCTDTKTSCLERVDILVRQQKVNCTNKYAQGKGGYLSDDYAMCTDAISRFESAQTQICNDNYQKCYDEKAKKFKDNSAKIQEAINSLKDRIRNVEKWQQAE